MECKEKYLMIVNEFVELEEMLEGVLDSLTMAKFKSKLAKVEYDLCLMYMQDDKKEFTEKTNEYIKAMEKEVEETQRRLKIVMRYNEGVRRIVHGELCSKETSDKEKMDKISH